MSSLSSFGMGDETNFTPIRLTDEPRPNTAYGKSKLLAEQYVRRQTAFPYVILRPTGVYGPGERDYFLEIQSIQAGFDFTVGMTPQRITFIYVKDLARVAFDRCFRTGGNPQPGIFRSGWRCAYRRVVRPAYPRAAAEAACVARPHPDAFGAYRLHHVGADWELDAQKRHAQFGQVLYLEAAQLDMRHRSAPARPSLPS